MNQFVDWEISTRHAFPVKRFPHERMEQTKQTNKNKIKTKQRKVEKKTGSGRTEGGRDAGPGKALLKRYRFKPTIKVASVQTFTKLRHGQSESAQSVCNQRLFPSKRTKIDLLRNFHPALAAFSSNNPPTNEAPCLRLWPK